MCIMNRSNESNIANLKQMIDQNKLVYDFDITMAIQQKSRSKKNIEAQNRISIMIREYKACFEEVRLTPENSLCWLHCSNLRLKLNNYLIERLLRDLIKRCRLHIRLLSGANAELYVKRASLLLDEITNLENKVLKLSLIIAADIDKHWVEGEVHAIELEFYRQKEPKTCKVLWGKLKQEETKLKVAIEEKKASLGYVPPVEGMHVSPIDIGSSVNSNSSLSTAATDLINSLPTFLYSIDSDFIVLGICALVLIGGTLYFWSKDDDREDKGDSGNGEGQISKSGIAPVSGLKELVPPAPVVSDENDVIYFDFYGLYIISIC